MSERRIALLTDAHHSGLPAFLVAETGLEFRVHGGAGDGGGTRQ